MILLTNPYEQHWDQNNEYMNFIILILRDILMKIISIKHWKFLLFIHTRMHMYESLFIFFLTIAK